MLDSWSEHGARASLIVQVDEKLPSGFQVCLGIEKQDEVSLLHGPAGPSRTWNLWSRMFAARPTCMRDMVAVLLVRFALLVMQLHSFLFVQIEEKLPSGFQVYLGIETQDLLIHCCGFGSC